jgi:TonB family protein
LPARWSGRRLELALLVCAANLLIAAVGQAAPGAGAPAGVPGEPTIEGDGPDRAFLRAMHRKIHARWTENFLRMASRRFPASHHLNDPGLRAEVEISVAMNGRVMRARLVKTSGERSFDKAAVEVAYDAGPTPRPPEATISDDGVTRVLWAFARDHRRCGEVRLVRRNTHIELTLPLLLRQKRDEEALRRVQSSGYSDAETLTVLATPWLKEALKDQDADIWVPAASILARKSDRKQVSRLMTALPRGQQVELVSRTLARLRVPACPLVRDDLDRHAGVSRSAALSALRFGAAKPCLARLVALAREAEAPVPDRVAAVEALQASRGREVKSAVGALATGGTPAVQGAALAAVAAWGHGKKAIYFLTQRLRHPQVEVRTGAAVGLIRLAHTKALPSLSLASKEQDPSFYEAVAPELAALSDPDSGYLLARFLRRPDRRIRLAGAAALASRTDTVARRALAPLRNDPDPLIRFYASGWASSDEQRVLAEGAGPSGRSAVVALMAGPGRDAAARWIIGAWPTMSRRERASMLARWVATTRPREAVALALR